MKNTIFLTVMLSLLATETFASDACIFDKICSAYGTRCEWAPRSCSENISADVLRHSSEQLQESMAQLKYTKRPLDSKDNTMLFIKEGSELNGRNFCLARSDLRTDCEGKRFEVTCDDNLEVRTIVPFDANKVALDRYKSGNALATFFSHENRFGERIILVR